MNTAGVPQLGPSAGKVGFLSPKVSATRREARFPAGLNSGTAGLVNLEHRPRCRGFRYPDGGQPTRYLRLQVRDEPLCQVPGQQLRCRLARQHLVQEAVVQVLLQEPAERRQIAEVGDESRTGQLLAGQEQLDVIGVSVQPCALMAGAEGR